jgi:hypothetical protein
MNRGSGIEGAGIEGAGIEAVGIGVAGIEVVGIPPKPHPRSRIGKRQIRRSAAVRGS